MKAPSLNLCCYFFSKKRKIKKCRGEPNEKYLHHGTSPDVIDQICAQNFDFCMSGKNAALYGNGSYFSISASYSDWFASKDNLGNRAMF